MGAILLCFLTRCLIVVFSLRNPYLYLVGMLGQNRRKLPVLGPNLKNIWLKHPARPQPDPPTPDWATLCRPSREQEVANAGLLRFKH
jgi:hypothetical protein